MLEVLRFPGECHSGNNSFDYYTAYGGYYDATRNNENSVRMIIIRVIICVFSKEWFFSKSLRLSNVVDRHCAASIFREIRNDGVYVPDRTTSQGRSHNT